MPSDIEVVLLGYQKQAGKDTLANLLVERDGFYRVAFADKLKNIAADLYGFTDEQIHGGQKEVIDPRYNMTPRTMLQKLGSEAIRGQVWDRTWTDYVFKRLIPFAVEKGWTKFVITDLRFKTEVDDAINFALHNNAKVRFVNVVRPELKTGADKHASENELRSFEDWDFRVVNFGTPTQMYEQFTVNYK